MSFLGMGTLEILVILLVAFIFLGPERMVDAARMFGRLTREVRRMTSEVRDLVQEEDFNLNPPQTVSNQPANQNAQAANPSPSVPLASAAQNQEAQENASPQEDKATEGPVSFQRGSTMAQPTDTAPKEPSKNQEQS